MHDEKARKRSAAEPSRCTWRIRHCCLGDCSLLAGCGSDKTTVTEDAGDADKKEESKKEEQPTTDLAVGTSVTTAAGLSVTVDSVQTGLTN